MARGSLAQFRLTSVTGMSCLTSTKHECPEASPALVIVLPLGLRERQLEFEIADSCEIARGFAKLGSPATEAIDAPRS